MSPSLAFDRTGDGPAVLLLHGWPGDRHDYAALELSGFDAIAPDLLGFGESPKPAGGDYSAAGEAREVLTLLDELGVGAATVVGYDIGSRVAQQLARDAPDRVRALVLAPPLPGVGERILGEGPMRAFWYQAFHRLPLSEQLLDGNREAIRAYLRHFWSHWSGPGFEPSDELLDRLVEHLFAARRLHGLDRVVPRRLRVGGAGAGRDAARGADRAAGPHPVARARPVVPARVG